mgnify:CR=1 FL=1
MSDAFWTGLFALLTVVVGILSTVVTVLLKRLEGKIEEVRHATNSLTDKLVEQKGKAEYSRGREDQRTENIREKKP